MGDTRLMKRCRQWKECSAPDCPLDPEYLRRGRAQPGEDTCTAWRSTRLGIVQQAAQEGIATVNALRYGGLTKKEWQRDRKSEKAKARFEAMPAAEQQQVRERLARGRRKLQRRKLVPEKTP